VTVNEVVIVMWRLSVWRDCHAVFVKKKSLSSGVLSNRRDGYAVMNSGSCQKSVQLERLSQGVRSVRLFVRRNRHYGSKEVKISFLTKEQCLVKYFRGFFLTLYHIRYIVKIQQSGFLMV
jgi:hypothetical protein